jgi:predicted kinase
MTTITLCRGLPASGKSTWAKQQVEESNGQIVRVNMDDIRAMVGLPYSKDAEAIALDIQDKAILAAVKAGKDVIVDNTHIEKNMPKRIKRLFDGEVLFKVQDFSHITTEDCITNDWSRAIDGERSVGETVIRKMAARIDKWKLTAEWMNDVVLSAPLEFDPDLPYCVVWDTDGTTAKHVARSPYDYTRVLTDAPHADIVLLKDVIEDGLPWAPHFGMSGRPDTCRADTEEWNAIHHIRFQEFYMRDGIDQKDWNDADVKQYMVDKYIRGKYNILAWFDDRDRVVRRLRKLQIRVLQVADGAF